MRRLAVGVCFLLILFVFVPSASAVDEGYVLGTLDELRACIQQKCDLWDARNLVTWVGVQLDSLQENRDKNRLFYLQAKRCYQHYVDGIDVWEREEKASSHDPMSYAERHFEKAEEKLDKLHKLLEGNITGGPE